jgi:hypothetical protein
MRIFREEFAQDTTGRAGYWKEHVWSRGVARHCEPLRHPSQPGLSFTSCQLIQTATTAGTSRVAHGPHCVHAVANTPAGRMELVRSYDSIRFGLPTKQGRVGSCITIFGACLAFTHVTACRLAKSPMRPSTPKASAASLPPPLLRLKRVERTSSQAGLPARCGPPPFHGAPD